MKRNLTIIAIILLIIGSFLGIGWYLARNKAIKNGTTPPSFKSFLGIGTSNKAQNGGIDGTNSSEFINPDGTISIKPKPITKSIIPIKTSVFTNSGLNPLGTPNPNINQGGNTLGGSVLPNGGGISGGGGTNQGPTGSGGTGTGGGITINTPSCSDEDLNITFTASEISQLNGLKNRFFAIAETLHTDADVATEVSNRDSFKSKLTKISELNDFCRASPVFTNAQASPNYSPGQRNAQRFGQFVPGINGPTINYRVATPFWSENKNNDSFVNQGVNFSGQGGNQPGMFSESDSAFFERSIERALRINLW
jgi:hypothetical protein